MRLSLKRLRHGALETLAGCPGAAASYAGLHIGRVTSNEGAEVAIRSVSLRRMPAAASRVAAAPAASNDEHDDDAEDDDGTLKSAPSRTSAEPEQVMAAMVRRIGPASSPLHKAMRSREDQSQDAAAVPGIHPPPFQVVGEALAGEGTDAMQRNVWRRPYTTVSSAISHKQTS